MKILNKQIADAGFYVNLETSIERNEHVQKQIIDFNISGLERVVGITDNPIHSSATSSHKKIFELAKERNLESILVLEDDFQLYNNVYVRHEQNKKSLSEYLDEIIFEMSNIEWDVIMLGFNGRKKSIPLSKHFSITFKSTGAWGYIIKKDAYNYILDNFNYWSDRLAIDDILPFLNMRGFRTLSSNVQIIHHAKGFVSTLNPNGPVDYTTWIDGNYYNSIWNVIDNCDNFDECLTRIQDNSKFNRENIILLKNYPHNWQLLENFIRKDKKIGNSLIVLSEENIPMDNPDFNYLRYHFSSESYNLVIWESQLKDIKKYYNNIITIDFTNQIEL